MGVKSEFDARELAAIQKGIANLSGVPSRIARPASKAIRVLIMKQFNRGRDPFGRSWAPLATATLRKGRRPPPLTATRAMRRSVRVKPLRPAGIGITIGGPAGFHQFGTRFMPQRQILPLQPPVLPKTWAAVISKLTIAGFEKAVK